MAFTWLRKLLPRHPQPSRGRQRARGKPARPRLRLEPLEERALLSTILWVNRGDGIGGDGFDEVFTTDAELARGVVDAAIQAWENVISDFNYDFGTNTFDLWVAMDGGNGLGGSASDAVHFDGTGKPYKGTINIQRGTDGFGAGWYLDPTPNDSAEFQGQILNAFAGKATPGGPTAGKNDLFTVVVAEMTHLLGLGNSPDCAFQQDPNGYWASTGIADAAAPGKGFLYTFTGPSVTALLTSNNSGPKGSDFGVPLHVAEPIAGNLVNVGGTNYFGAQDSGNPLYSKGERYLPSRLSALILQDAYGYTVNDPTQFGTFYASLNTDTGELLLRGGEAGEAIYAPGVASADTMIVDRSGGLLFTSIALGMPVPGTAMGGPLVSNFAFDQVTSIRLETGDGDDIVVLDSNGLKVFPPGGIDVDAGLGTDSLTVVGPNIPTGISLIINQVTLGGEVVNYTASLEELTIIASPGNHDDSINVDVGMNSLLEKLTLVAGGGADTINIESTPFNSPVTVAAGAGDDTLYVSLFAANLSHLGGGTLLLNGGPDSDALTVYDHSSDDDRLYTIEANKVWRGTQVISYEQLESLELNAGDGDDDLFVQGTGADTTVKAGFGDDTIVVNSNGAGPSGTVNGVLHQVRIQGGMGTNSLTLVDRQDVGPNVVTVTDKYVGSAAGNTFFGPGGSLTYGTLEALTLNAGSAGDMIVVADLWAGTATTINAGGGPDTITVQKTAANTPLTVNAGGGHGCHHRGQKEGDVYFFACPFSPFLPRLRLGARSRW